MYYDGQVCGNIKYMKMYIEQKIFYLKCFNKCKEFTIKNIMYKQL